MDFVKMYSVQKKTSRIERRKREEIKMMKRELTVDQMNQVNGGYAVDGENGYFYSVDDNDGFVYTKCNINIEYAIWASKMNGVSQEVISKAEYERRFGKTLN